MFKRQLFFLAHEMYHDLEIFESILCSLVSATFILKSVVIMFKDSCFSWHVKCIMIWQFSSRCYVAWYLVHLS